MGDAYKYITKFNFDRCHQKCQIGCMCAHTANSLLCALNRIICALLWTNAPRNNVKFPFSWYSIIHIVKIFLIIALDTTKWTGKYGLHVSCDFLSEYLRKHTGSSHTPNHYCVDLIGGISFFVCLAIKKMLSWKLQLFHLNLFRARKKKTSAQKKRNRYHNCIFLEWHLQKNKMYATNE